MSLQADFDEFDQPQTKCKTCEWRATAADDVRDFFDSQVKTNAAKMTRFCRERFGLDADESSVRNHIRKGHA